MSWGPERLAHPEWLQLLLLLWIAAVLGVALSRLLARRRRRRLGPSVAPGVSPARDAALLLALAAIGAALLGPRIGHQQVSFRASGVDVAILVDVSRSMDVADVPPSRLDRARRAGEELLARLAPGDRVALAAFAGRGVLLTPLTPDRVALTELLGALDTQLMDPPASNLGAGVRAALTAFEQGSARPRLLLVLSDGEDPLYRSDLGIPDALDADVRVVVGAFGSEAGGQIPDRTGPLRDASGAAVVSRRRVERLQRLAAATDGAVFRADRWGVLDFDGLAAALRRDVGSVAGEPVERRVRVVQVLPFAVLAFLLLAGEGLLPRTRPLRWRAALQRLRTRRRAAAAAGLALVAGLSSGAGGGGPGALEAQLRNRPGDASLLIELGLARLARGRHDAAQRAFLAAALSARDPELAALAYYDLGVAALADGDQAAARDAFFDALALHPTDRQARFNLEWALAALPPRDGRSPPPAPEPQTTPPARPPEQAQPDPAPEAEAPPQQPLDAEHQRRWLARVRDDPTHALRGAVRAQEKPQRSREPAW